MTYRRPRDIAKLGMVQTKGDERPPLYLHIMQLYKGDILFRSLMDVLVIGLIVVAAKSDWSAVSALSQAVKAQLPKTTQMAGVPSLLERKRGAMPFEQRAIHGPGFGGEIVHDMVHPAKIEEEALNHTSEPLRGQLYAVKEAMDASNFSAAWKLIDQLDDTDPTVAYVKAVLHLRKPNYDVTEQFRLLKRATEQSVYPAYIVLGNALVTRVNAVEIGAFPPSYLVLVDDAGVSHAATREEVLAAAALAYERAASFGTGSGLRLLGLARARGWGGKRDLIGAVALWRQGAAAGDPLSKHELGRMLQSGSGVQPDLVEAQRLYRETLDDVPASLVALAVILLPDAIKGDEAKTGDALAALDRYEALDRDLMSYVSGRPLRVLDEMQTLAYALHGQYLSFAAPPHMRDQEMAVQKFERAAIRGDAESAFRVAEALRLGNGAKSDPACAYGFYLSARRGNSSKVDPILKSLAGSIGSTGVAHGKRIMQMLRDGESMDANIVGTSLCG